MSWNNVKQLPWFPVSLLLSPSLRFPNAPLKWSHGSGNSSLAPAHRRSHPKTTLVQTEWQTRDDTVSSASYAQHVPWFNAGGKSDDAAEFCWRGVFPISTGAQQTEKYHLLNNYPKNFVCKLNIFWKKEILKGWNCHAKLQRISVCAVQARRRPITRALFAYSAATDLSWRNRKACKHRLQSITKYANDETFPFH